MKLLLTLLIVAYFLNCSVCNPFNASTDVTSNLQTAMGTQLNYSIITGYIPIDWYFPGTNTSIFFQLTTKQGEQFSNFNQNTPLVVWFNGGPGSDSQYGSWCELGPLQVQFSNAQSPFPNLTITQRPFAWNTNAMLLFIDQPIGVGFSYSSNKFIVNNTETAANHIENFFYNFFTRYSNLTSNPFYIFGESFGGHYIPAFANKLKYSLNFTQLFPKGFDNIFQGIGIGDGWTFPQNQITTYDEYEYSIGIISGAQRQVVLHNELVGLNAYQTDDLVLASNQFEVLTNNSDSLGNIDIYNFNYYDGGPDAYDSLLSNEKFQTMYGIPSIINFNGQGLDIYGAFQVDIPQNYAFYIVNLLNTGVGQFNVFLYNGQNDIIVNTPGATKWINSLNTWNNLGFWQEQQKQILQTSGVTTGNYQFVDNFCYAVIYNAGHMVPFDQPQAMLQLFQNALNWKWPQTVSREDSQKRQNMKSNQKTTQIQEI